MTAPADRLRAALADRYRLDRELGAGGMATVYLAEDLRHQRKVALKVLRPELAAVLGAERFLQEIRLTANFNHPHILPLFDSGEADGMLFYVMPYVEGETLRARMDREQRLPLAEAVRIAGEVAGALDYAHRHGVIHRDVKPENVLLHDGRALVADFGIALAPGPDDARLTGTGMSVGTPHYMSPEQALGQRDVDARTDVYATGAMLYEMLIGTPPFTGPTPQAIVAKVIVERPAAPARLRNDVPAGISDAILTALQKEPARRFASAAAFQSALAHPVSDSGVSRTLRRTMVLAALVILAALGAMYVARRPVVIAAGPAPAAPGPVGLVRRMAVIPFRNGDGDTINTSFSEGLTLEINDALSRLPGLTVVAASSKRFRGVGVDVAATGAELGVDAVLTGLVDTADNIVRVRVELHDARTRVLRWSQKYDRAWKDLYQLEDSLSVAIAHDLRLAGPGGDAGDSRGGRTGSAEAHALLVQARGNAELRTKQGLNTATALFTAAIELDSGYAQAWAGRAKARSLLVAYGYAMPKTQFPAAKADAAAALRLDSAEADAHAALGIVGVFYDHDWPAAASEFSRALQLDSTAAATWLFRGWYFVATDHLDSAAASIRRAARVDPGASINPTRLGTVLYLADDLPGAETALNAVLRRDPGFDFAHTQLAEVYASDHRCDAALKVLPTHRFPAGETTASEIASVWARCGRQADARQYVRDAERRLREGEVVDAVWLATVYAALGDDAKVFAWLGRAVETRSWALFMLGRHPAFKAYRADPRFRAIMRQAKLI